MAYRLESIAVLLPDAIVVDKLSPRLQVLHRAAGLRHARDLLPVRQLGSGLRPLLDLFAEVDEEVAADAGELAVADELALLERALEHLELDLGDEIVVDWFRLVVVVDLRQLGLAREKTKFGWFRLKPGNE